MAKSKFGWGLVLGAVLGGAAAMFLTPKTGKENRELAKQKLEAWKKKYKGKSTDEIVKGIFGEVSSATKGLYTQAQNELNKQLDELKKSSDEIDQGKYKAVVKDVIQRLRKEKDATTERLNSLQSFLMERWDYVQEESKEDVKKVAKDVKKK